MERGCRGASTSNAVPAHCTPAHRTHPFAADERTTGQTARFLAALARDGKVEAADGGLWRLKE
jgi:hypothetical protein